MLICDPGRKDRRKPSGHWVQRPCRRNRHRRRHWSSSETVVPYRPASRQMGLTLAIPYLKRSSTGFAVAESRPIRTRAAVTCDSVVLFGYSGDAQCRGIFIPEFCIYIHGSRPQLGQGQLRLDGQDLPRNLRGLVLSSQFNEAYR
jgi:hypothetical protein